jgi:hypothetical protein
MLDPSLGELQAQFERLSWLSYLAMRLTNDWGDAGPNQIQTSFCRVVLHLPPDHQLTYLDMDEFERTAELRIRQLGLNGVRVEDVLTQISQFSFKWKGKRYPIEDISLLSKALEKSGLNTVIQGGYFGKWVDMIFGAGETCFYEDIQVIKLTHEFFCTPTILMSITAMIAHKMVCIRLYSLKAVFYQKWVSFAENNWKDESKGSEISAFIKKNALMGLPHNLAQSESDFVADMYDNVLYHELGHAVIQHHTLNVNQATMGEGAKLLEDLYFIDLLEILAEIAPVYQSLEGPLWHMIRISKTNPERARRMFWIYWSDSWFFDTQDTYMYAYSGYLALIMKQVIHQDQVDFDRLGTLLSHVLDVVLTEVETLEQTVSACLNRFLFSCNGSKVPYSIFLDSLKQSSDIPVSATSDAYLTMAWVYRQVFEYALTDESLKSELNLILQQRRSCFESAFYLACTGRVLEGQFDILNEF